MNSLHHTPQTNTKLTTILTPVTEPQVDVRRAERVQVIFDQKYDQYRLLANRHIQSMADAKDIVASVFLSALHEWPTEKFEAIRNLEAYMYKTVRNRAINFAKRQQRLAFSHEFPLDTFSIINPMDNFDLDINAIIQQLPPKQQAAFALFMDGYSHEEIAKKLTITVGASKNLVYYAKLNLKKLLSELPGLDPDDRGPSATRRGETKRATKLHSTNLHSGSGPNPKVKDLLNYLNGTGLKARDKENILQWLVYQEFAFEIISGLKLALKNHNAADIVSELKKDKDSLRAQLFGTSSNHEQSNKYEQVPDSINKWDLSVYRFNHKIEAQIIAPNIRTSLSYNISPRIKNNCTLNQSNNHPLNNQNLLSDWEQNLSACSQSLFNPNNIQFYQLHFNLVKNTIHSEITFIKFNTEALQHLLSVGHHLPCDKPAHKFQFAVYQIEKGFISHTHKTQPNNVKESEYPCLQDSNVTDTLSEQSTWNSLPIKEGKKNE